jgi:hypothetical protein
MLCPSCLNEIPDRSVFCNFCGKSTQPQQQQRRNFNPILWVALVVLGLFLSVRYLAGNRASDRMVASIAHTTIMLKDETQNLRASSWRSIPIQPPYNGSLDVTLDVVRGNPLDVLLVDSSQMDVMKRTNDWGPIQGNVDFSAIKTTTYHRTAPINQGTYFLVLRDTSLGILSQSSSDVSVKVVLNP